MDLKETAIRVGLFIQETTSWTLQWVGLLELVALILAVTIWVLVSWYTHRRRARQKKVAGSRKSLAPASSAPSQSDGGTQWDETRLKRSYPEPSTVAASSTKRRRLISLAALTTEVRPSPSPPNGPQVRVGRRRPALTLRSLADEFTNDKAARDAEPQRATPFSNKSLKFATNASTRSRTGTTIADPNSGIGSRTVDDSKPFPGAPAVAANEDAGASSTPITGDVADYGDQPQSLSIIVDKALDHPQDLLVQDDVAGFVEKDSAAAGDDSSTNQSSTLTTPATFSANRPVAGEPSALTMTLLGIQFVKVMLNGTRFLLLDCSEAAANKEHFTQGPAVEGHIPATTARNRPSIVYSTHRAGPSQRLEVLREWASKVVISKPAAPPLSERMSGVQRPSFKSHDIGSTRANGAFGPVSAGKHRAAKESAVVEGLVREPTAMGDFNHQHSETNTYPRNSSISSFRDQISAAETIDLVDSAKDLSGHGSAIAEAPNEAATTQSIDKIHTVQNLVATNNLDKKIQDDLPAVDLPSASLQIPRRQVSYRAYPRVSEGSPSGSADDQRPAQISTGVKNQPLHAALSSNFIALPSLSSFSALGNHQNKTARGKLKGKDILLCRQKPWKVTVNQEVVDKLLHMGLGPYQTDLIYRSAAVEIRNWVKCGKFKGLKRDLVAKYTENPQFTLKHEARILLAITHNNIVTAYLFRKHARTGMQTLLLEKLENRVIREVQAFTPQHRLNLMKHMSHALMYLHGKNLVHNDIKPDNICYRLDTHGYILVGFGSCTEAGKPPVRVLEDISYFRPPKACSNSLMQEQLLHSGKAADIYSLFLSIGYVANWNGLRSAIRENMSKSEFLQTITTPRQEDTKQLDWRDMAATEPASRPSAVTLVRRLEMLQSLSEDLTEIWPDEDWRRTERNEKLSTELLADPRLLEEVRQYHRPLFLQLQVGLKATRSFGRPAAEQNNASDDVVYQTAKCPGPATSREATGIADRPMEFTYQAAQTPGTNAFSGAFSDEYTFHYSVNEAIDNRVAERFSRLNGAQRVATESYPQVVQHQNSGASSNISTVQAAVSEVANDQGWISCTNPALPAVATRQPTYDQRWAENPLGPADTNDKRRLAKRSAGATPVKRKQTTSYWYALKSHSAKLHEGVTYAAALQSGLNHKPSVTSKSHEPANITTKASEAGEKVDDDDGFQVVQRKKKGKQAKELILGRG